jgi:outer membrane protein assembly factor BamB
VPTPAVADGRVFAFFGSSILHALDTKGAPLWSHVVADHDKFDVAIATSPVIYKDTVLLTLDRRKPAATIISLDARSGDLRWKQDRPEQDFSHVTPVLATVDGRAQLLVSSTNELQGLDPQTGEAIWSCRWGQSIWPVSSPVTANGLVYAVGGRGGHGGAVVDPTGRGDVTDTHLKWKIRPMSEGLSSPVAFADRVYRLNSPAGLRCVRISDGEELFKEPLPNADPSVSPFATPEGRIYFASAGKTVVIEASDQLKILAESDLGDPSRAAAAVANGHIYLKGSRFLHAIGK